MAGGDLYKSLNRNNFLSTVWDNIINTVLGNRQKKLIQPPVKEEEQLLPETGADKAPLTDEQVKEQSTVTPYLPETTKTELQDIDTQFKQGQLQPETPYVPSGEGQGYAGGDIPENKVYVPNVQIPTDKINKPKSTTTGKLDTSGLKMTAGSKTPDQQANEQLTNELLNYITETGKFGSRGAPFINTALNAVYPLQYKQGEQPAPKMTGHEFTTDKDGNLLQYVFDPTSRTYNTVPVLDPAGNPIKQKLPEYDKNRIQVTVDKDGNAVLYNMQSGEEVKTGKPIDQFDKEFGLETDKFEFDKEYKTALLQLKAQKQSGSGKGKGNGTTGVFGDLMVIDNETGSPVDLTDAESPISKIVQNLYSGNKKTKTQASELLKVYFPNLNIVDTKKSGQLEDAVREAGDKYKNGKINQQQFQDYLKNLEIQSPNEMKFLRKKYAR